MFGIISLEIYRSDPWLGGGQVKMFLSLGQPQVFHYSSNAKLQQQRKVTSKWFVKKKTSCELNYTGHCKFFFSTVVLAVSECYRDTRKHVSLITLYLMQGSATPD